MFLDNERLSKFIVENKDYLLKEFKKYRSASDVGEKILESFFIDEEDLLKFLNLLVESYYSEKDEKSDFDKIIEALKVVLSKAGYIAPLDKNELYFDASLMIFLILHNYCAPFIGSGSCTAGEGQRYIIDNVYLSRRADGKTFKKYLNSVFGLAGAFEHLYL